jgi:uncharacterized protein involved in copper resistance
MKRTFVALLTAALVAVLPLAAAAQHDHGAKKKMDQSTQEKKKMDHGAHTSADYVDAHKNMVVVGAQTVKGVKGEAHLNDVREAMARLKMKETHHFMVMLMDEKGTHIEEGTAAVKITGPEGKESDAIRLVAMDGHFGADIVLAQKGKYTFNVGTRLADGQTRQFEFTHTLQ